MIQATIRGDVIVLVVLVGLSAFFSASEAALFSMGRHRIARLRETASKFSMVVVRLVEKPRSILVTILLGNEVVNGMISIVAVSLIGDLLGGSYTRATVGSLSVAITTAALVLFGDIIPKSLGARNSELASHLVAPPLTLVYHIFGPLRRVLTWIAEGLISFVGVRSVGRSSLSSDEELKIAFQIAESEGVVGDEERRWFAAILKLKGAVAADIMTPKAKMFSLPVDISEAELVERMEPSPYSRIPIYKGNKDNILGVLYRKDLIHYLESQGAPRPWRLDELIRRPYFVPKTKTMNELLNEFKEGKIHLAFIVGEYGNLMGLVTLEDILKFLCPVPEEGA